MPIKTSPRPADVEQQKPDHEPLNQPRAMELWPRDGVLNDLDGGAWKVTANGADKVLTIGRVGDTLAVRNQLARITDTAPTIDLAGVGTGPGAGQRRNVLTVARLNLTGDDASLVTIAAIPGANTSGSNPTTPAPTKDATVWEVPLCVTREEQGAITNTMLTDVREHIGGDPTLLRPASTFGTRPVGTFGYRNGTPYVRDLAGAGGAPAWVDLLAGLLSRGGGGVIAGTVPDSTDRLQFRAGPTSVLTNDTGGFSIPTGFTKCLIFGVVVLAYTDSLNGVPPGTVYINNGASSVAAAWFNRRRADGSQYPGSFPATYFLLGV